MGLRGLAATSAQVYHAPQQRYLPANILLELFFGLPLPDVRFFELILENYPIPIAFV